MRRCFTACLTLLFTACLCSACVKPAPGSSAIPLANLTSLPSTLGQSALLPTPRPANSPYFTPTPDAPHAVPTLRSEALQYSVQSGDSLVQIAQTYNLNLAALAAANHLTNADMLKVGQVLTIPAPQTAVAPSTFKIIPDSELVYGPESATLDVAAFVRAQGGYLSRYSETYAGLTMSGAQIVATLAKEYSVSPRLLLALLEYQSGWVTQSQPPQQVVDYPLGLADPNRQGLYRQLSWAANQLNRGFYLWGVNALSSAQLSDAALVAFPATLNAGTVSLQRLFALVDDTPTWSAAVSENGFYAAYARFFGLPFDLAVEPLLPADLTQPAMQLPFESGDAWSLTSGPHSAWGDSAAWAALDFAPPGSQYGCYSTAIWETAVADGVIARSENGEVVLDLDGDGLEETGWTVLYMHVAAQDRIALGTRVKAGDRIGHPSCEGGVSNGTHLHLARRYNGVWIAADGNLPFVMDGWVSAGTGTEYDGTLIRGGQTVTAWDGRIADNRIQR
jgi:murein DD-endopeptidase MepM/ murein hydrolase activator NlpD